MNARRVISGGLALLWMATIFYLSSHPMPDIDLGFSAQDKLEHLIAYGLLGALLLGALSPSAAHFSGRRIILAVALTTLYGLSDEWHQSFVPGRTTDALDLVADAVGGLLGCIALWTLTRWFMSRRTA